MPFGDEERGFSLSAMHGKSMRRADGLRHLRLDDREFSASCAELSSLVSRQALSSCVSDGPVCDAGDFVEQRFAGRLWRTSESERACVMHAGVRFRRRHLPRLPRRASARSVGIDVRTAATISVRNATCLCTKWCIAVQGVASSTIVPKRAQLLSS